MAQVPYTKPYATPAAKVAHLRSRGLHIPRPNVAARKIELIGYDRLRIYCEARRDPSLPNRPFIAGTTYHDILQLYTFDAKLRALCFDATGQFEVLFRNSLAEVLAQVHGPHPYSVAAVYRGPQQQAEALRLVSEIYRKTHDPRARHYRSKYSAPPLPPIWVMKEFMTFGEANIYCKTLTPSLKLAIATLFGVQSEQVFSTWVDALVQLRNVCAHHARLFNHSFQKQPSLYRRANLPVASPWKLAALLECLDYLTQSRGAGANVVPKASTLIGRHPAVRPAEVGF